MSEALQTILNNQQVIYSALSRLLEGQEQLKMNQGISMARQNSDRRLKDLREYEFKVFSQWGEDGIIQQLIQCVEIKNKTFIEFGVEDFSESNCRFLLMKDNWKGFVIDGSKANVDRLQASSFYWRHHIHAVHSFITRDNINELLALSRFDEDLGILSIDIDGNDYHVLESLALFKPRILICEYNSVFGGSRKITIPYAADFDRTRAHYSNLYFGASLAALTTIAERRGYALVGTNSVGSNAFYVRRDLLNDRLQTLTAEQAYFPSNIRESRDPQGRLNCLTGDDRLKLIQGLQVVNVETGDLETL